MARKVSVEVVADASQFNRTFSGAARTLAKFGGDTKAAARAQIVASAEERTALKQLAEEYALVSRNATKGSDVQVAAARKAAAAYRQLGEASVAHGRGGFGGGMFEKDAERSARGAIAASLSFRGLGRAAAYASGYLIGGAGLALGLKAVTNAAIEHQAEQKQLQAAIRAGGQNFKAYSSAIQDSIHAQENLGFSEDDATKSFVALYRATGSVEKAQKLQAIAANLSRGRNMDLASATQVVIKGNAGMAGSIRRLLPFIGKHASAIQILEALQQKYAGAAKAYAGSAAGEQARLSVAIHATEVAIGSALLPTITKYSSKLATWLDQSKNQERLQHDVATAVHDTETAIEDVTGVIKTASHAVGGFKHVLELVLALKFASKVSAWASSLQKVAGAQRAVAAANIEGSITAMGGAAATTAEEVGGLRGALLGLSAPEVLVGLAAVIAAIKTIQDLTSKQYPGSQKEPGTKNSTSDGSYIYRGDNGHYYRTFPGGRPGRGVDLGTTPPEDYGPNPKFQGANHGDTRLRRGSVGNPTTPVILSGPSPTGYQLSEGQKTALALSKNPESRAALAARLAFDAKAASFAEQHIKAGKGSKALVDSLKAVYAEEQSIRAQIASLDKKGDKTKTDAHKKELAALKKAREEAARHAAALKQEEARRAAALKQAFATAVQDAFSAIGDLGQGPVATGPAAQFLEQYGGHLTAKSYTKDIAQQNKAFKGELANLNRLRRRGAPESLLKTLFNQGASGAAEAAALAGSSQMTLRTFLAQYKQRQRLVTQAARMEVTTPHVTVTGTHVNVQPQTGSTAAAKFGRVGSSGRRR